MNNQWSTEQLPARVTAEIASPVIALHDATPRQDVLGKFRNQDIS